MELVELGRERGVRTRHLRLGVQGRLVPGLLWTPIEPSGPAPLVALGHGASRDKGQDVVVALARRLVRHHGIAALALDGPVHGERRGAGWGAVPQVVFLEFAQRWAAEGDAMTDQMVADWRAALDVVAELDELDPSRLGYWGLSMGTILGLPLVAAEPRIQVAVLGLCGLTGPTRDRLAADAPRVTVPTLFLVQWDDELFPRDSAFALFAALGATDKRLHAHPGAHGAVPAEELDLAEAFLALHLLDDDQRPGQERSGGGLGRQPSEEATSRTSTT
jgi:dienelactone hydrolase